MMADIAKVKRNISRMIEQNAPEADIDAYIASEGVTLEQLRSAPKADEAELSPGAQDIKEKLGPQTFTDRLAGSFGLSDEITGVVSGIGSLVKGDGFGKGYEEGVAAERSRAADYEAEHPGRAITGDIAGTLAIGPGKLVSGATKLGARMLQGAKEGAGFGAVAGAAHAEGGLPDRAIGAATGAGIGGAVGSTLPAVLSGARAAASPIIDNARALMRPQQAAARKVSEALDRDHIGVADALAKTSGEAARASEMTLADVAGENTRGLLRSTITMPGEGRDAATKFLLERQSAQPVRVSQAVKEGLGDGDKFFAELDRAEAILEKQASPLYQKAFKQAEPVDVSEVVRFIDSRTRPGMSKLLNPGDDIRPDSINATLARLRSFFASDKAQRFDLQTLHNVKMDLDGMIGVAKRSGDDPKARALMEVKRRLVQAMDEANPAYKQARSIYAGGAEMREILEAGRRFLRQDAELTARDIMRMSPTEKQLYRMGAAKALSDEIASVKDGGSVIRRIFGNQKIRGRLRAVFPNDKAFREFQAQMLREEAMERTKNFALGGSNTANKLAELKDAGFDPEIAVSALRGDVVGAAMQAIRRVVNRAQGLTPQVAKEIADMLTGTSPERIQTMFANLEAQAGRDALARQKLQQLRSIITRTLSTQGADVAAPQLTAQ